MAEIGRYLGQFVLYGLFAVFIGYFSSSPQYSPLAQDQALLRLSFKQPGELLGECRTRTAEELQALPKTMRAVQDCPSERAPVRVRIDLDGQTILEQA